MIDQIKSGHCDTLFYKDIEPYFQNDLKIKALRKVAIRYIEEVFKKITYVNEKPIFPNQWGDSFSYTDNKFIKVFIEEILHPHFFDESTYCVRNDRLDQLIKDVQNGYWDNYFNYDYTIYTNNKKQVEFYSAFLKQQQNMQNPQAINQTNQIS
jgi:hypothetical protein